jgi:hypothetical protein
MENRPAYNNHFLAKNRFEIEARSDCFGGIRQNLPDARHHRRDQLAVGGVVQI